MSDRGAGGHGRVMRDVLLACGDDVVGFIDCDAALALKRAAAPLAFFEQLEGRALCPARVHPKARVGRGVRISAGTLMMAAAVLIADVMLGRALIVKRAVMVEQGRVIGDRAQLSPGAALSGGGEVDRSAWTGAGAVSVRRVHIGEAAVVGVGSTAIGDVTTGSKVVGSPARQIRSDRTS